MKQELIDYLNSILYYKGKGAINGIWETWKEKLQDEEVPPFIQFNKPIGQVQKNYGWLRVRYYHNSEEDTLKYGHEFCIERYIPSYCEVSTVFEGWLNNTEELKLILNCVGLDSQLMFISKAEYGILDH